MERPRRAAGWGRPRDGNRRVVVQASRSVRRTGCRWRALPYGCPASQSVSWPFTRWTDGGTLVQGRKRFIVVDTKGRLLGVAVLRARAPGLEGG